MPHGPDISRVAALFADPARANILTALMSGQALTATEFAEIAGVSPQTTSGHLAQLLAVGFVAVEKQGRHRYYRLSSADVAAAIESLMGLAQQAHHRRVRPGPKDPELRLARVCYDHLAGMRGVELFERLSHKRLIVLDGGSIGVSPRGMTAFTEFGIDVAALRKAERPICRTCLDWSERKSHLAGALGASLLERFFELGWANRDTQSRVVRFTKSGETKFARLFT